MKKILIVALLILFIIITASSVGAVEFGSNSANIKNTYLPLKPGMAYLFYGYGSKIEPHAYLDIAGTDIVDGVKCTVVNFCGLVDLVEFVASWVAQDISGNIYVLKEYDSENSTPTIVYGKDNALLVMPKDPKVNDIIFGGDATVVETGVTVSQLNSGIGPFANCIKVMWSDGEISYFAPNIGEVKNGYPGEVDYVELKEIFKTKKNVVVIPLSD